MSTFRQEFPPQQHNINEHRARDDNFVVTDNFPRRAVHTAVGGLDHKQKEVLREKCKMTQAPIGEDRVKHAESHLMSLTGSMKISKYATARVPPRWVPKPKKNKNKKIKTEKILVGSRSGCSLWMLLTAGSHKNTEFFLADQDSLCTSLMTSEITPPVDAGPRDGPTLTAATLSLGGGGGAGSSLIHAVSSKFVHFPLVPA